MAGNFGKFIDRMPIICAAGKPSGDPELCVRKCLQMYSVQDQVDALKHDGEIYEEHPLPFSYKLPSLTNKRHEGIFTNVRATIRPPDKTNYQTLINDLKETSYESYWNKVLGRTRDPIPGLPAGMKPLEVTFGKASKKEVPVGKLVNPPKAIYEVLYDSQVGHDMYKKTHNDYNPGEQVDRRYQEPAFNPNNRYGQKTPYDPRGIWVRCACHWHETEPVKSASAIQADVLQHTKHVLGKSLTPNNNIKCVPKGFMFGKLCKREMYGMEELLKDNDCPPCIFKRDFYELIAALNVLRGLVKNKNPFIFDMKDFHNSILYYDQNYTGWIPIDILYEICKCYHFYYEYKYLEPLFYMLGIFVKGQANYGAFINIIDSNKPMPELFKIEDVPKKNLYYITTSQAASCDFLTINNADSPTAGLPSTRFDLLHSTKPEGGCAADIDHYGDETTAGCLINPSIYTNYGLSHRDFFLPRSANVIKKLFQNIGYDLSDDVFNKLWKQGVDHDKTGFVCVNTFQKLFKKSLPPAPLNLTNQDKC